MSEVDREKIEAMINWRIVEYLELEEKTSNKLLPLMKEYNEKRHSLFVEQRQVVERLMELSEKEEITRNDAKSELKELDKFYDEINDNRKSFFKKAELFLDDRQYIKLKIVEEKMKSDFMRQLREKRDPQHEREKE